MLAETKDEMRDKILEAALKRFIHYGASKTTMNEIAEDLHCSKASLYYYYSDKKALHQAVLEKIGEAFFQEQEAESNRDLSATECMLNIIEIKRAFVERFRRLELFKILNDKTPEVLKIMVEVKQREDAMMTRIIARGVATGEFQVEEKHVTMIAELYNQALHGLRFSTTDCFTNSADDLSEEQFEMIVAKQKMLTEIFVRGLKQR